MANIGFAECSLDGANGEIGIVEVEKCAAGGTFGRVVLEHVVFRNNVLNGTSAGLVANNACAAVEMSNVSFVDNACSGTCFAHLSLENRLTNVTMRGNTVLSFGAAARDVMISLPAESMTNASGLIAEQNNVTVLRVVTGGQLTLRDSRFSHNIPRTVIALTASTHVALSDCQFSQNESDLQGEATIYANRTKLLWLTRCTFEGNKAKHGGALFASQRSVVRIQRSTFRNNVACKNGGALNADKNSAIHLEHSRFVRNQALDDNGGGIRCRGANVTLEHRVTLRHNEAGYNGGAISAEDSCQMDIANASIIDNMSRQTGGGVSVRSGSTAILRDTVFRDNDAKYRGGAIFVERATLTMISSRFSKNVAVGGGSLALRLSAVNVTSSVFEKDEAKVVGGSINALWRCQLSLTDVSIMASRSKIGAGLYLAHSFLTATNLHVSTCNATESGGGLHAGFASAFSCRGCAFEGNIAGLLGGGVSLNATHPLKLSYNFTNSRFTENRAGRRGGASAVVISAG